MAGIRTQYSRPICHEKLRALSPSVCGERTMASDRKDPRETNEPHLTSFFNRNVFQPARSDVFSSRPNQPVVPELLQNVSGPAGDAAAREDRCEQICWDSERVISRSRIEVDVRVQMLFAHDDLFHLPGHLVPLGFAGTLTELARHLGEVDRSRINSPINPMTEAHYLLLVCECVFDPRLDRFDAADLEQVFDHALVGAAVKR